MGSRYQISRNLPTKTRIGDTTAEDVLAPNESADFLGRPRKQRKLKRATEEADVSSYSGVETFDRETVSSSFVK